jgi:glycine hydroxymethyltransferase
MLLDLRGTGVTGKTLEKNLDEVYITVNKNAIPNDPEKPTVTSGIRVGTPAVTTRGFKEPEMTVIADCIADTVHDFEGTAEKTRQRVNELCENYHLY